MSLQNDALRRKVLLKGDPEITEVYSAVAAITPGHQVEIASATTVQKHSDDASNGAPMFALERAEMNLGVDDPYAAGDVVKVGLLDAGDQLYAWIPSGQNVTAGNYLTGDGAGRLTKTGVAAGIRTAVALETVDNSAGPGDARIRVQVV